ncbi:hypothetical protein [Pantanalinema sp. GBBB05]|uniref:hypothetical protein n=1 Tax=Pantanalinema sp. GBBB05 TaxID=2604139 RepID=UPI001DA1958C|nr:hypothetical protein [Pantanalinema sp. GBBB05]
MSQSLSIPLACQGFAALCLTLFAVTYSLRITPPINIRIALTALSLTIASFVICCSLLIGLAVSPFLSPLWAIATLVHDRKVEDQVTVGMPTALALNLFQPALVGLLYWLTMIVVLMAVLKDLTIAHLFSPKPVIYSDIPLLRVGIWQLHTVMDQISRFHVWNQCLV